MRISRNLHFRTKCTSAIVQNLSLKDKMVVRTWKICLFIERKKHKINYKLCQTKQNSPLTDFFLFLCSAQHKCYVCAVSMSTASHGWNFRQWFVRYLGTSSALVGGLHKVWYALRVPWALWAPNSLGFRQVRAAARGVLGVCAQATTGRRQEVHPPAAHNTPAAGVPGYKLHPEIPRLLNCQKESFWVIHFPNFFILSAENQPNFKHILSGHADSFRSDS